MRGLIAYAATGSGVTCALAYCALALSDARFVIPMIDSPIRFLGLPALFGAMVGGGAYFMTNRR